MKKVNKVVNKGRYKQGARKEKHKTKNKPENFPNENYQAQFPQLGAGSSKASKEMKQNEPVDTQFSDSNNKHNIPPKSK